MEAAAAAAAEGEGGGENVPSHLSSRGSRRSLVTSSGAWLRRLLPRGSCGSRAPRKGLSVKMQRINSTVPKGTLHALFGTGASKVAHMDWDMTIGVLLEVARGIARIHKESASVTRHDVVKSSTVHVDNNGAVARLSEFGLALILCDDSIPEIIAEKMQKLGIAMPSKAYDIYLYGKLLLETITQTKFDQLPSLTLKVLFELVNNNHHQADQDMQVVPDVEHSGHSSVSAFYGSKKEEMMIRMLKLGLSCHMIQADKQPTMEELAMEINFIKSGVLLGRDSDFL